MHTANEDRFMIHAYTKEELARLYNPDECIGQALKVLARWVRGNKELWAELERVGYNKFRRSFTPLEVSLIVRYLGEP